jgi:hypothetical protein
MYCPSGQELQSDRLFAAIFEEKVPEGQGVHPETVCPGDGLNVPAGQP